jgi:hydroxymethylpyrimidine pyrophosphatase-like HAD family hydrolase
MGNAPHHVKVHADWIAPSIHQQGAAAAIRRYALAEHAIA